MRILLSGDTEFRDLFDPVVQAFNNGTPNPAFSGNGPRVFDTWSNDLTNYPNWSAAGTPTSIPLFQNASGQQISIKAIQISLRVWDFKTKKTRQVTLVQQM